MWYVENKSSTIDQIDRLCLTLQLTSKSLKSIEFVHFRRRRSRVSIVLRRFSYNFIFPVWSKHELTDETLISIFQGSKSQRRSCRKRIQSAAGNLFLLGSNVGRRCRWKKSTLFVGRCSRTIDQSPRKSGQRKISSASSRNLKAQRIVEERFERRSLRILSNRKL